MLFVHIMFSSALMFCPVCKYLFLYFLKSEDNLFVKNKIASLNLNLLRITGPEQSEQQQT